MFTIPPYDLGNIPAVEVVNEGREAERLSPSSSGSGEEESSIVLTPGFPGDELYQRCKRSWGYFSELIFKGEPEKPLTTITGADLKRLNEDPDLLFTLTKFSVLIAPSIIAEDITTFLCELEPMANLTELELDTSLNDDQLIRILNRHTKLKRLTLYRGGALTDKVLSALTERGSQFDQLLINACSESMTHESINKLFASLTNITFLWFVGKAHIDADHLQAILSHKKIRCCRLATCTMTAERVSKIFEEIGTHATLEMLSLVMPSMGHSASFHLLSFSRKKTKVFRLNERFHFIVDGLSIIKI